MMLTSNRTHLPQILRGLLIFFALIFTTTSCDLFRKAETSNAPKKNPPREQTNPTKPNTGVVLVDTVRWKIDPKAKPPIASSSQKPPTPVVITDQTSGGSGNPTYDPNTGGTKPTPTEGVKEFYNIALLLPFNSDKFTEGSGMNSPKSQFALDFYAGAKLALDSLSTLPTKMTVNVLDSKDGFLALSSRYEVGRADVIIGPIEKDNVTAALAFSTRNNVTVVSPYFPTGDVETANPNFVQIKPSLKTHCTNIVQSIANRYPSAQVVLAARSKENESSRFNFFEDANKLYSKAKYEEWKIEDDINFNPEPYIEANGTTVFVVPSWNEAFVTSFLKKLNASPRRNQVVVYGMPQWTDFDKSLNTYYENLKVRVSSSTFIDNSLSDVQYFKTKFLRKFGKLPNSDAFLGYDCMLYVGKQTMQYGNKFPYFLNKEQQPVLHTKFYFNPVYRSTPDDSGNNVSKYENSYVNILKFQNNIFRLDE